MAKEAEDENVVFTLFENAKTTRGLVIGPVNWLDAIEKFIEDGFEVQSNKLDAQLLGPKFKDGFDKKNEANLEYIQVIGADYDDITPEEFERIKKFAEDEQLACLYYSTFKHHEALKKGLMRVRFLFGLSRPVYKQEYPYFWEAFSDYLGGTLDRTCKDPTRGYFLPTLSPEADPDEAILGGEAGYLVDVDPFMERMLARMKDDETHGGMFSGEGKPAEKKAVRRIAKKLEKKGLSTGGWLLQMLDGEPYASPGNRDNTTYQMCQDLGKHLFDVEAGGLAAMFGPSLSQMPGDHPITVLMVQEKIERAQREVLAQKQAEALVEAQELEKLHRETGVPKSYTREHIQEFIDQTDCGASVDSFKDSLIVLYGKNYYVYFNGDYRGPHPLGALYKVCRKYLLPARDLYGIQLDKVDAAGNPAPKTGQDLFNDYGSSASSGVIRLGTKQSFFDTREDVFVIASCPLRPLEPEFSDAVDKWMRAATRGDLPLLESWRDWMAAAPDLDKPLAMLVLLGKSGIGKTSFAKGMAKLWSTNVTSMDVLFGDFQESVLECVLLLADEEFPKDHRGRVPSAKLRSVLSAGEHRINQKHLARIKTAGYFRLVTTLQSYQGLRALSYQNRRDDVDAILQRILVVECHSGATFLFDQQKFIHEDAIAKHALWLREHRKEKFAKEKPRFGICAPVKNTFVDLHLIDPGAHYVLEWVCRYLDERKGEDSSMMPAFVAKRKIFLHVREMYEMWQQFFGLRDLEKPKYSFFRDAVAAVTKTARRIRLPSSKKVDYFELDLDLLRPYAKEFHGDLDLDSQLDLYTETIVSDHSNYRLPSDLYPSLQDKERRVHVSGEMELDLEQAAD